MWMNVGKSISDSSVREKELYVRTATDHTNANVNKDFTWTYTSNTVLVGIHTYIVYLITQVTEYARLKS